MPRHQTQLTALQTRLGYTFADIGLLEHAMTHRSFSAHNNERLEYLGDAVLGLAAAALLYERFAHAPEGDLTRMRAAIVCKKSLAECARGLAMLDCLVVEGVVIDGVGGNSAMLADALESTLGAMYLDGGMAPVQAAVARWFAPQLNQLAQLMRISPNGWHMGDKTRLKEHLRKTAHAPPQYEVISQTDNPSQPVCTVACHVDKLPVPVIATDTNRRKAEQCAARFALAQLGDAQ